MFYQAFESQRGLNDNHWHGTSVSLYILFSNFSTCSPNYTRIHVEILDGFDFCLRIRMPRLPEGLILQVRQHEIVWKYIIWAYSETEEADLWQSGKTEVRSHLLEWRQIWNVKLQIFCSQGRREVRRRNFPYLAMKADLKCETTDLLQSRQKESAEAELPLFGSEGRVLVEKPIFRSLAVKIERKCRSETENLWKSRQRWNAEAELHIFWIHLRDAKCVGHV